MTKPSSKRLHLALLLIGVAILAWSAWKPHDYFTWILEVFPAIIAGVVLTAIYPRFRFTSLVYVLILIHAVILIIGGHYTYAEMPLFNWLRDEFHLTRNYYDRLGHVAQGFVPAIIVRELLIRNAVVNGRHWLFSSSAALPLPSAPATNSSNGGWPWPRAQGQMRSSLRRVTCGTLNGTCSWRCAARSWRSSLWPASTTGSWAH